MTIQPTEDTTVDLVRDAQRVYNLALELNTAKRAKREAMRMHNEDIRRIQAEIEEIISRATPPDVEAT